MKRPLEFINFLGDSRSNKKLLISKVKNFLMNQQKMFKNLNIYQLYICIYISIKNVHNKFDNFI